MEGKAESSSAVAALISSKRGSFSLDTRARALFPRGLLREESAEFCPPLLGVSDTAAKTSALRRSLTYGKSIEPRQSITKRKRKSFFSSFVKEDHIPAP
jgi:hypothetical protein